MTPDLLTTGNYTCPMHPQIRQPGPGNCPICGMILEPVQAPADAKPSEVLRDMTRRFWIALALGMPVFILEMASHFPFFGLDKIVTMQASIWAASHSKPWPTTWPPKRARRPPSS